MSYEHIPDQGDRAVGLLLSQHENDPKFHALVRTLIAPFQRIEDALPALREAFDITNISNALIDDVVDGQGEEITTGSGAAVWTSSANGKRDSLTRIGAIVGEPRNNRGDSEYLAYVIARTIINRSKGESSDLYAVARALLGDTNNTLRLQRTPPAAYRLYVGGNRIEYPWDPTVPADVVGGALADMLLEATGAGISFEVYFQTADDAHTFTFSSFDDVSETDPNRGFADDLQTQGGHFIGVEIRT